MPYSLGQRSLSELDGVHPDLVRVVNRAIRITPVDFTVHDGLRSEAEQQEYVARGVSKTMRSKHLRQDDGYGHAVDLVPYINGRLRWEWRPVFSIAEAVRTAALELNVAIRWGGCWMTFTEPTYQNVRTEDLMERYCARKRATGQRPFPDGPHYELASR